MSKSWSITGWEQLVSWFLFVERKWEFLAMTFLQICIFPVDDLPAFLVLHLHFEKQTKTNKNQIGLRFIFLSIEVGGP